MQKATRKKQNRGKAKRKQNKDTQNQRKRWIEYLVERKEKASTLTVRARPTKGLMARKSEAQQVRSWLLAFSMPLLIVTPSLH